MDLETIRQEARAVAEELITTAQMKPGQILVVGCSSSEIHNSKLGTDSSQEIGQAVFEALYACTKEHVRRQKNTVTSRSARYRGCMAADRLRWRHTMDWRTLSP